MSEAARLAPFVGAVVVVVGLWAAGLARLGLLTPPDVRAWRRLAGLRGYAAPQGRVERAVSRLPAVRRAQEELDLHRLLAIAGWPQTPVGFLLRTVLIALLAAALFLAVLVVSLVEDGGWAMPPAAALLVGALVFLLQMAVLHGRAEARRQEAAEALGDMMMLVAIMTDDRGLQLEDAVRILSRCAGHSSLEAIVGGRGWQRLVREPQRTTIELYRAIAAEYRIPLFATLAEAALSANAGLGERETYSRVALAVHTQRLAEARFRAARARTLVTLPVAGMLVPLLVLIGAPVFAAIAGGLGVG